MKIISNKWKTFFVEETNFLLKTDKAFFIKLPGSESRGVWLGLKMARYNEKSKTGKQVYAMSICKDLTYKIYPFMMENEEPKISKEPIAVKKGDELINEIFTILKR